MLKRIMATTALSALLVAPVLAQDTLQPDTPDDAPGLTEDAPDTGLQDGDPMGDPMDDPAADMPEFGTPETDVPVPEDDPLDTAPMDDGAELDAAPDADVIFAEDVIGADLVDFEGDRIASVDDAVLDQNGNVEAVLVDVGGFLGFWARTVAISINDVTMDVDADGNTVLRTAMTSEDLENLPEYEEEAGFPDPGL